MLQRDCMVSTPAIQASQPSSPRALVHSQQVALVRARDAAPAKKQRPAAPRRNEQKERLCVLEEQ
eukprot:scaffold31783_cov95-Phaeocystis_antarctica.AAC.1